MAQTRYNPLVLTRVAEEEKMLDPITQAPFPSTEDTLSQIQEQLNELSTKLEQIHDALSAIQRQLQQRLSS